MTQEEFKKTEIFKKMPNISSTDLDWLKWISILEDEIGYENAKNNFIALWQKRGSKKANTNKLRTDLKRKYDIDIDENVFQKIFDFGTNTISILKTVSKVGLLFVGGAAIVIGITFLSKLKK